MFVVSIVGCAAMMAQKTVHGTISDADTGEPLGGTV